MIYVCIYIILVLEVCLTLVLKLDIPYVP